MTMAGNPFGPPCFEKAKDTTIAVQGRIPPNIRSIIN